MIDRKQLKAVAKAQMTLAEPSCWKVMLLWTVTAALLPQLILTLVGSNTEAMEKLATLLEGGIDPELALRALQLSVGQLLSTGVLSVVLNLFQMVMSFGLTVYMLHLYRGQPCGVSDLFSGFSITGRVIGQQLLVALIPTGCILVLTLPLTVLAFFAAILGETLGMILMVAAGIAIIVVLTIIMLSFVLASYALADHPELKAMGSIQMGQNLMRGHKGQYVVLLLSFLGWSFLCALPMGIYTGVCTALEFSLPGWAEVIVDIVLMLPYYLWFMPYMQTTIAGFYDALERQARFPFPQMPPL